MFAPTKLQRGNIFIPDTDVEEAAVTIARFEKLHLNIRHEEGWRETSSRWNELLDKYLEYKGRIDKLMSVLDVPLSSIPSPRRVEPSEQVKELDKTIGSAEDEILRWKEKMDDAESKIDHLGLLIQEARLLLPLEMPVDEIRNPSFLSWSVGTMSRENLERLKVVLFRVPVIIVPIKVEPERVLIVAAADRDHGEFLARAARGVFMEPVELPEGIKGIPKEVLPQLEKRLQEQKSRKKELLRQREELRNNWIHRLQGLAQSVECNLRISRAITSFDKHGSHPVGGPHLCADVKLERSDDPADITGGVVITEKESKRMVNVSFEARLSLAWDELRGVIFRRIMQS